MKRAIHSLVNALGYEVHKRSWLTFPRRKELIQRFGINLVLDVGANSGQYASELRRSGYLGRLWSYEPMRSAFAELEKTSATDDHWRAINCGCGAKAGNATINVAKNSCSSSLLPMLEAHATSAPESAYISQETVSICSLDESVVPSLSHADKVWLKIDTQGYEAEVLKGATRLLPHVYAVECELSMTSLYEGQLLIGDMITMFYQMGFRMVGVAPVFSEPETGYALQIDGVFLKA